MSEGGLLPDDTVNYTYQNRLRMQLSLAHPGGSPFTDDYGYEEARRLIGVESSAGQFDDTYLYNPFGNMLAMSGPLMNLNKYRFSSKEWNENSGLYYYMYRFYDPSLQRWPNRDPNGEKGALNLYEFVANDPVDEDDPEGLGALRYPVNNPDEYGNVTTTCTQTGARTGNMCQYRCDCPSGYNMGYMNPYSTRPCDGPAPTLIALQVSFEFTQSLVTSNAPEIMVAIAPLDKVRERFRPVISNLPMIGH